MKNILASLFFLLASIFAPRLAAQIEIPTNDPPQYGPYNGTFLAGGDGLKKQMVKTDTVLRADSPWSLWAWVRTDETPKSAILLMGIGEWDAEYGRYIGVDGDKLAYWGGKDIGFSGNAKLAPGEWHLVGATFDGQVFRLYAEGAQVAEGKLDFGRVTPLLQIAPAQFPVQDNRHFAGKMAGVTLVRRTLDSDEFKELAGKPPAFSTLLYDATMLAAGMAFFLLRWTVMRRQRYSGSLGRQDTSELWKHSVCLGIYLVAIAMAFYRPWLSLVVVALITVVWVVPGAGMKKCSDDEATTPKRIE